MQGLIQKTDHIQVKEDIKISLNDSYVIGISIENLPSSGAILTYGLDEGPKIQMSPGDSPRPYGGFHACDIPCCYTGTLEIKWPVGAVTPNALVILHRLTGGQKTVG